METSTGKKGEFSWSLKHDIEQAAFLWKSKGEVPQPVSLQQMTAEHRGQGEVSQVNL